MSDRIVSATEFRTRCLQLLDEVEATGSTITVTRRGKAVATLGPHKEAWKPLEGLWADKAEFLEDLLDKGTTIRWDCTTETSVVE